MPLVLGGSCTLGCPLCIIWAAKEQQQFTFLRCLWLFGFLFVVQLNIFQCSPNREPHTNPPSTPLSALFAPPSVVIKKVFWVFYLHYHERGAPAESEKIKQKENLLALLVRKLVQQNQTQSDKAIITDRLGKFCNYCQYTQKCWTTKTKKKLLITKLLQSPRELKYEVIQYNRQAKNWKKSKESSLANTIFVCVSFNCLI